MGLVAVTGGLAFDYLMSFPGNFTDHLLPDQLQSLSLSFLVDSLAREHGGTAGNIAYNLALLQQPVLLLAAVGQDGCGYVAQLKRMGVDIGGVLMSSEELTGSFFGVSDQAGNQIAQFYSGATVRARQLRLADHLHKQIELVLISPDDPQAMSQYVQECQALKLPSIYDPSQQIPRLIPGELIRGLSGAKMLMANEYEFGLIKKRTGLTDVVIQEMVEAIVITLGASGSLIRVSDTDTGCSEIQVPAVVSRLVDPTGAGDAYRAGFITGLLQGYAWEICGRLGAVAASYALEERGSQHHHYDYEDLISRYQQEFGLAITLNPLSQLQFPLTK